jgi:hypothetical protein
VGKNLPFGRLQNEGSILISADSSRVVRIQGIPLAATRELRLPAVQTTPTVGSMDTRTSFVVPNPHDEPPMPGEVVMVITGTFRCRGYIDAQGVWHHDSDDNSIENVIGWLPYN